MIEVTIAEAAQRRGISNPKQLADKIVCAPTVIWRVWTGRQSPTVKMIGRICEALDCEVSEVLRRIPDKKRRKSPTRQNGLKRKKQ